MIQSLKLESYRGFRDTTIEFSNITCIIGENSTGKSTIIEAIQNLLRTDRAIPQNHCKAGVNDKNATSLSLAFQDGSKLSKNIQNPNLEKKSRNSLPKCLTTISPIGTHCAFPVRTYAILITTCAVRKGSYKKRRRSVAQTKSLCYKRAACVSPTCKR